MARWEYKVVKVTHKQRFWESEDFSCDHLGEVLNLYGNLGWDMTSWVEVGEDTNFLMKRRIE